MFWGNSSAQCDVKACFGYQFSSLPASNQYQKRFKNNLDPLSPLSSKVKQQDDTVISELAEKRSLKKYASPKRNPETSSITSSIPDSATNAHIKIYSSPQRKQNKKNPNNEVIFARHQLALLQNQQENLQTLDTQESKNLHKKNRRLIFNKGNSNTQRTFDSNLKLSVVSHMSPQKNLHEKNFQKKQTVPVVWQNSHLQYNVPNVHSYRNSNQHQSKNRYVKSPIKFTYISPPKTTYQATSNIRPPIKINPQNNINIQSVKQSPRFFYQQQIPQMRRIEKIPLKNELMNQQFPIIREQNEYYEQSGTVIQSKHHLTQKSQTHQQQQTHEIETHKTIKRENILKQINQVLHSQKEIQPKSLNRESFNLSNCEEDDQTSVILPNESHVEIDLLYEGLLTPTQRTLNQQVGENVKQEESIVDNAVGIHNCSLSPSEQYCYYRRPKHLPSIALRVIQNKLRAHNYQFSQIENSEKIIANSLHYSKESHQKNQNNIDNNKFQNAHNEIQSRWKKLYEEDDQNNTLSKQVYFPFNIKVEECRSEWVTDGEKNASKNYGLQESSLVDKLTGEKATEKVMREDKFGIDSDSFNDVPTSNACNDKPTSQHPALTDSQCPLRKQIQKKFKTLVNRKVTIHSIVQQDFYPQLYPQFYPQQTVKFSTNDNEHIIENKFKLDGHMMGRFSRSIPTSYQNIDRGDQSTVIDKITFRESESAA